MHTLARHTVMCRLLALLARSTLLAFDAAAQSAAPGAAGREAPRARFVLLFLADLADHHGQIANDMRALGLGPPSALPVRTAP